MSSVKKSKKKMSNKSSKRPHDDEPSNSSVLAPPLKKPKVVHPNFRANARPHEFLEDFFLPCLKLKEHQKYLVDWMICRNILKKPKQCGSCEGSNIILIEVISGDQKDEFQFQCVDCKKQMQIHSGSFFERPQCSIAKALLCILAWCKEDPPALASVNTGVPRKVVNQIFLQCLKTAENYVTRTNAMKKLVFGGPDSVVLLDVWPHGYIPVNGHKREVKQSHRERLRVLWIADSKHIPVLCWPRLLPHFRSLKELQQEACSVDTQPGPNTRRQSFLKEQQEVSGQADADFKGPEAEKENQTATQPLTSEIEIIERFDHLESTELCLHGSSKALAWTHNSVLTSKTPEGLLKNELMNAVLSVAEDHIAQGSLILVNEEAMPNLATILLATGKYEAGTSFSKLLTLGSDGGESADSILEKIWQPAINLCAKMQTQTRSVASGTIAEFQWRCLFGSQTSISLFNILNHISSHYVKTSVSMHKNEV